VTAVRRKLHREELNDTLPLTSSELLNRGRRKGQVMWHARKRNIFSIVVEQQKGKKQLGRPRHRWKHILDLKHRIGGLELD